MNPWLLKMLEEYGCRQTVVIQPTQRAVRKTDRRDAGDLAHLLWVHRPQGQTLNFNYWECVGW